jgi:hypothetical protein
VVVVVVDVASGGGGGTYVLLIVVVVVVVAGAGVVWMITGCGAATGAEVAVVCWSDGGGGAKAGGLPSSPTHAARDAAITNPARAENA